MVTLRDKKRFNRMLLFSLIVLLLYTAYSNQEKIQEIGEEFKESSSVHYTQKKESRREIDPALKKRIKLLEVQTCFYQTFNYWANSSTNNWFEIPSTVERCAKYIRTSIPFIEAGPENYEKKYYMIPRLQHIAEPCSVITFGIGGEIVSEQHIKMTLPHCTFFGFDPNPDYETLFVNDLNGHFLQTAVSGKNGNMTIFQLKKEVGYAESEIKVRAAADLIRTYHGTEKIVDILNIDIEGSEYGIFEQLTKDKIFQNVCQINIEIHPVWYHNTGYSFSDVIALFKNVADEGTFVWVKTFIHYHQFYPSYFINIKNEKCIEKFLKDRLYY